MKKLKRFKTSLAGVVLSLALMLSLTACVPSTSDEDLNLANEPNASSHIQIDSSSDMSSEEVDPTESSEISSTDSSNESREKASSEASSEIVSSKLTSSKPVSSKPVSSVPASSKPVASKPAPVPSAPISSAPTSSVPVSSAPVSSAPDYSMSQFKSIEDDLVARVNELRRSNGLSEVTANATLKKVAALRSKEMTDTGYFEHTRPNGSEYSTAFDEIGYAWARVGENIAYCSGYTEDQIGDIFHDGWLNSPGHYANMVRPEYTQIGIAIYTDGTKYYATQSFGVPNTNTNH